MRILFASAHPYLPQIAGGSQSNTHEMALELMARGHEIGVLAGLTKDGWSGLRSRTLTKLTGRKAVSEPFQGYQVFRAWHAWEAVADTVKAFRPDIAVVQSGSILRVAQAFREAGVKTVIYLHNVEFDDHGAAMDDFRNMAFLSNSQFTAGRYREVYGIGSVVIPPLFQPQRYKVESQRKRTLFINPHPLKGLDLALQIAELCPELGFDFVESWTLSEEHRAHLRTEAARLGNIQLYPRTFDMREHYARARIVLIPSKWEETWGRVASEAHYSAIPVLATRIGGLVEAVGSGGVLMDVHSDAAQWAAELKRLCNDPQSYDDLSQAALTYSQRPEIDRARQIDQLETVLASALN